MQDPYAVRLSIFVTWSIIGLALLWIVSPVVAFLEVFGDCTGDPCDAVQRAATMRVVWLFVVLVATSAITGLALVRGRRVLPALVACIAGLIVIAAVAADVDMQLRAGGSILPRLSIALIPGAAALGFGALHQARNYRARPPDS